LPAAVALDWIGEDLEELEAAGLTRTPRVVAPGPEGPLVTVDGRQALLFCSNDYLGLSGHPLVREAAIHEAERAGVGACSSRLVCGTQEPHRRLEERLAGWLGRPRAVLLPAGFMANLAVLTTVAGRGDVIFSDALNHASIVQGARLSRAAVEIYPHRDLEALEALMDAAAGAARRMVIVTDSVFSVDGDAAPLEGLARLAERHGAALVVDEAHALGVLGPGGRGLAAEHGVRADVIVGTLGKAFGVAGAFVAGSSQLGRLLESRAVPHIYTTAPPAMLAAAAEAALELVEAAEEPRRLVRDLARRLREGLRDLGCDTGAGDAHIVPALVPGVTAVVRASAELLDRGVYVQALRPPTVPPGTERLRWTATARHTAEQVDLAVSRFGEVLERLR